ALIRQQPDLTLDEMVLALRKRRISASRSALSRFFVRHGITIKKKACRRQSASAPTWLGRADAGSASKACLILPTSYLSTKLQSRPTWCGLTVGTRAESAWSGMCQWDTGTR